MYAAFTYGYWGTGSTIDEAKSNARRCGATPTLIRKHGWLVKRLPVGATNVTVDDYGSLSWVPDPTRPHDNVEVVERPKSAK